MTSSPHDSLSTSPPSRAVPDDETPTRFDSSFAADAAHALHDAHWTSDARAGETSIDSALARFEQASTAFAAVARAARANVPASSRVADPEPEPSGADANATNDAAAAVDVDVDVDAWNDAPDARELADAPDESATPSRPMPLKPTPWAGRALAPADMVARAFEDTRPNFPSEAAAMPAAAVPNAIAPRRRARAPWFAVVVAVVVACGAFGVLRHPAPKAAATTPEAAPAVTGAR